MNAPGNSLKAALGLTLLLSLGTTSGCGGQSVVMIHPLQITISTPSLSDGTMGAAYAETIQASGGTAPYNWSVSLGALPGGLTLEPSSSSSVMIAGTPSMAQSNAAFTLQVSDASGQSTSQAYTVSIRGTMAQVANGALQGVVAGNVLAFRGIPYAAPPVGNLRWKPPQPAPNWAGVRDASTFANFCPQLNGANQFVGDEDCLYLNIYVSTQTPHGQQLPVMFYIHGGGNRQGQTHGPAFIDAPNLANQGVMIVTIEYRLGLLGFLTHPQLDAEGSGSSGNYGLMDQIAALNWVHQNISDFGGDPAHVTIFGQSAGSFDIQALLTSPSAQGLFSGAIMESGVFYHGQVYTLAQFEPLDAPIVPAVGCSGATNVLACLRGVPAAMIVANQVTIPTIPGGLIISRSVVIEPRVLPMDPFDVLQQNGSPVPLIIGSTREEEAAGGASDDPTATPALNEAGYEAALHADFDSFGPNFAAQVLALYPASSYDAPVYALIAAESDCFDLASARGLARAAVHTNGQPVWRYLYTHIYENDPSLSPYRAFHTAELGFVFGDPASSIIGPHTPTPAELTLSSDIMGYWSRFAKNGDPNGAGAVTWPKYDPVSDAMLQIDDTQTVIMGYHNPQEDFFVPFIP
jgi:para-nitrobenzyl esterase